MLFNSVHLQERDGEIEGGCEGEETESDTIDCGCTGFQIGCHGYLGHPPVQVIHHHVHDGSCSLAACGVEMKRVSPERRERVLTPCTSRSQAEGLEPRPPLT